ncbi:copper chaperone PCu(A)C [Aureimonas leprariae]|uniref:Copper chaperone PCu(A)C n=1 Tax=Plantimonas leprariae TaxID=2615207 RepID=A0A7V7TVN1_9HYPH|nr:copper chaperone PCu(A)C [Aureimonas leprariae]KAB0678116.1 copper chaperone PCu(A)C [Aureimonas leprariae]
MLRNTRLVAAVAFLAAVFAPFAASSHEFKVGSIVVGHPWSRATPPAAKTGGGYLTLTNGGTSDDRLLSARSPAAPDVQIHEMKVENGVMTMRRLENGLPVPAGQEVALKPGASHLMLIGLRQPLKAGDSVPLTLVFEKAGAVDVTLKVEKLGAPEPGAAGGKDNMQGMEGMTH